MRVLSHEDHAFWEEHGYVVVSDAVPTEQLRATVAALWAFSGLDPQHPETWHHDATKAYREPELAMSGMIEIYHHQSLWENRQHPRVYGAFADIWGRDDLWVTFDRANINVPARPDWQFEGFIHWDIDTSADPMPYDVQGVLSLTDVLPGAGGFQCVPGFHRRIEEWIGTQPADRDPFRPDLTGLEVQQIPTQAGDLLIWDSRLPHGTSPNRSDRPRLAQYISMFPADETNDAHRARRLQAWRTRTTPHDPQGFPFPGDPRRLEEREGTTAELTDLGRKLLGLDRWTGSLEIG
jgi:Phytanoyl-CoA dioxygenase (PhyH)